MQVKSCLSIYQTHARLWRCFYVGHYILDGERTRDHCLLAVFDLAPVLLRRWTQIGERSPFQGDVSGFDARRRYYERGTMMYDRLANGHISSNRWRQRRCSIVWFRISPDLCIVVNQVQPNSLMAIGDSRQDRCRADVTVKSIRFFHKFIIFWLWKEHYSLYS